jgi:hypothetical protein
LPRFGDAVKDTPRQGVNEKAYAIYKDERLYSVLPREETWDDIVLGIDKTKEPVEQHYASKLIPGAGHAVLTSNGKKKMTAAITFGPYGGFHGHYDKLSFVLFGNGEELGVDPGRSASQAYRLPIHSQWYKASTGHNVVLVDGTSQKEAEGKFLSFRSNDSTTAVVAYAGPAFDHVSHERMLYLTSDYLLVVDELKSTDGKEHTFDWLYHNKGKAVSCNLTPTNINPENKPEGYSYLKNISGFKSERDQLVNAVFTGDKTNLLLNMTGNKGDEVFTATGPFTSVEDRVPMIIVRRKGELVRFITVLEPVDSTGGSSIKSLNLLTGSTSFKVAIDCNGKKVVISFPKNNLDEYAIE